MEAIIRRCDDIDKIPDSTLLSAADVANVLGVSVRTAQRTMLMMEHMNICLGEKYQCLRVTKKAFMEYRSNIKRGAQSPSREQHYDIKYSKAKKTMASRIKRR